MSSQAKESPAISAFKAARTNAKRIAAELVEAGATITYAAPVTRGAVVVGLEIRGETRDASGRCHLAFTYSSADSALVFNQAASAGASFGASHAELLAAIRAWSGVSLALAA